MKLINGKEIANNIYTELSNKIKYLEVNNITPGLAVILIGNRIDSQTYVNMKRKNVKIWGIKSRIINLDENIKEELVVQNIKNLNNDDSIHGILIQLPLPSHLNEGRVLSNSSLEKDIDGFHYSNIGKLTLNRHPTFVPYTPKGCIELLKEK